MTSTISEPFNATGRVILSSHVFRQALSSLLPFVSGNAILPILENALVTIEDGLMSVIVSDLQTFMKVDLPVESTHNLRVCIPITEISKLLGLIAEQPITILFAELEEYGRTMTIVCEEGRYTYNNLDSAADYPKQPAFASSTSFSLSTLELRDLFRSVSSYISTDDLRPAMTGVYWEVENNRHELAATDGHRLVRLRPDIKEIPEPFKAIIPRPVVMSLAKILPKKGDKVTVEVQEVQFSTPSHLPGDETHMKSTLIRFSWGAKQVTCRVIDERFPDYSNAIPTTHNTSLRISRQNLISSIRRASLFSHKSTHQMKLNANYPASYVEVENLDYGRIMKEKLKVEDFDGDALLCGFNARLLLETLKSLTSVAIELRMQAANRAVIIHPVEKGIVNEDILSLLMPISIE